MMPPTVMIVCVHGAGRSQLTARLGKRGAVASRLLRRTTTSRTSQRGPAGPAPAPRWSA